MTETVLAVSRLGEDDTRDRQVARAVQWLLAQPGGDIVIVTPRKDFSGPALLSLVSQPGVSHRTWRGFSMATLDGQRALLAWPNRALLNELWDSGADAVCVIEWGEPETAEWIARSRPVQLLPNGAIHPEPEREVTLEALPNGVDGILEYVAATAAGYASGLQWREEDKLKADMMNRPARWAPISVAQVRAKCEQLGVRPNDIDTIAGYLQRRKAGRRFNVRSDPSFHFADVE